MGKRPRIFAGLRVGVTGLFIHDVPVWFRSAAGTPWSFPHIFDLDFLAGGVLSGVWGGPVF